MGKIILNKDETYFAEKHAENTAKEIHQQPEMWKKVAKQLLQRKKEVTAFMNQVLKEENLSVIFTGAGSSAFVGEVMERIVIGECDLECRTIHTTDIISSPKTTLKDKPTLLVSYARSGESPESVASIQFAKKKIKNLYNLIFVCDGESSLAKFGNQMEKTLVVALPKETCDQGFAMTSSVSSMAFATWIAFHYQELETYVQRVIQFSDEAEKLIIQFSNKAEKIAQRDFRRLIWLGSGPLQGLARESAVKSMELSNGYIHASFDGAAAFRHGPKTVINEESITIHLITNDNYTKKYDIDLNNEINSEKNQNLTITVAEKGIKEKVIQSDYYIEYPENGGLSQETQMGSYIYGLIFAQIFSMFKSIQLGYATDNPCPKGDVNRVVKGIVIYHI